MSEDMSDRMPEDLPVRKYINVMVGITRSKVIFDGGLAQNYIHHKIDGSFPLNGNVVGPNMYPLVISYSCGEVSRLGIADIDLSKHSVRKISKFII